MVEKKIALVLSFVIVLWCMFIIPSLDFASQMMNVFIVGNLLILNAMMIKEIWRPENTPLWIDNM